MSNLWSSQMINASLNWASISGLLLLTLWIPALFVSLRRFDALMRRDHSRGPGQGLSFGLFLINLAGRTIALPLAGGILFFQGWRLDPILQFGLNLLVLGVIFESMRSIRADGRELKRFSRRDTQQSVRQLALENRLQDRVWPWSIAHCLLPFAGIYYAITRRTITPLLWDFLARFAVLLASAGILVLCNFLLPIDAEQIINEPTLTNALWVELWIRSVVALLVVLMNVVGGVLPVRAAIRRIQADAQRRLAASA